jgi:hypothetical protein
LSVLKRDSHTSYKFELKNIMVSGWKWTVY